MGIPLGHKLKIIKKIKDLRTSRGMSVSSSRQGTRNEDSYSKQNSVEAGTPLARGDTSTQSNTISQEQLSSQPSSLKNGNFDEAASHNHFLEALNEWRSNNTTSKKDNKSIEA